MRILQAALLAAALAIGLAQAGFAADLPVKAPVYKAPAPVPVVTWSGCYVGGNIGYGWSPTKWTDETFFVGSEIASHSANGVVGGGQIGCDYQIDPRWVIGIRGMVDAAGMKGSSVNPLSDFPLTDESKITWLATVTGRLGYVVEPMTLLYVQGGAAWVHAKYSECCSPTLQAVSDGFADKTWTGWTVGGGLEHMFTPNWSAFIEYNYIGLGGDDVAFTGTNGFPNFTYHIDQNVNLVLVGLNYRFGPFH